MFYKNDKQSVATLQDKQDAMIKKLSNILEVKMIRGEDGKAYLFNSHASLITNNVAQFSYNSQSQEILRTDTSNMPQDFSRLLEGGSLHAMILMTSKRPTDIASPDYGTAIIQKLRNQLDNIAYNFYHDGTATSHFSKNITPQSNNMIIHEHSGIQAGSITIETLDAGKNRINGYTVTITNNTTLDQLKNSFNHGLARNDIVVEQTQNGQFIVRTTPNSSASSLRITDTTNMFGQANNGSSYVEEFPVEQPTPFALSYNNATRINNASRTELNSGFFTKVNISETIGGVPRVSKFSVHNFRVNADFDNTDIHPPISLKRASANGVINSLTSHNRSVNNSGLYMKNGTYQEIAIGLFSNIARETNQIEQRYQGQNVALQQIQKDLRNEVGVNMDVELARLTTLQNSYNASARCITTSKEMLDSLLSLKR